MVSYARDKLGNNGHFDLCTEMPPGQARSLMRWQMMAAFTVQPWHALRSKVAFSSQQSNLLLRETAGRYRYAWWLGRKMKMPGFGYRLPLSQEFCTFGFWAGHSAGRYVSPSWADNVLLYFKKKLTLFLRVQRKKDVDIFEKTALNDTYVCTSVRHLDTCKLCICIVCVTHTCTVFATTTLKWKLKYRVCIYISLKLRNWKLIPRHFWRQWKPPSHCAHFIAFFFCW